MELRWSPERVSDLPKVTELVSGRMEVAGPVAGKRHRELSLSVGGGLCLFLGWANSQGSSEGADA